MSMSSFYFSIAPMMGYTHRHYRYLARMLAPSAKLYTEMVTMQALMHGNQQQLLAFHPAELPVALQLGGNDPMKLAECAKLAEQVGFSEVNLNVGCPSPRVQEGAFGACLLKQPDLVADCIGAMKSAVAIPVTVKTRIGVDDCDAEEYFFSACQLFAKAGADEIIVHARKAWLKGLSPKENRSVPPLNYERVWKLKQILPEIPIVINGGFTDLQAIKQQQTKVDGIMIGRAAVDNPLILRELQQEFGPINENKLLDISTIVENYMEYAKTFDKKQQSLLMQPLMNLLKNQKGARLWRQTITQEIQAALPDWQKLRDLFLELQLLSAA